MATKHTKESGPEKRLMTEKEAANYMGLSTWSVRVLRLSGRLPFISIPLKGDAVRPLYDRADVDALIESSRVGAQERGRA